MILLSGDIKTNPGPISSSGQCFSICHRNSNSMAAHNYDKLSLLTASNLVICHPETYLNSETLPNDTRLELPGYNLLRSDHPSNNKRGGVCIYYKSTLPLRILNISMNVSTLRSVLPTQLAASSSSIDLLVKSRTSFKHLNQI